MSVLSEEDFRRQLEARGLALHGKAFEAALAGGRHLKAEVERLKAWLASLPDRPQ